MAIGREDAIRELFRRDALTPQQREAVLELNRRGKFDLDSPVATQESNAQDRETEDIVKRSLQSAGFDPGQIEVASGLTSKARRSLDADRVVRGRQAQEVAELTDAQILARQGVDPGVLEAGLTPEQQAAVEAGQQIQREFEAIPSTDLDLAAGLAEAQPEGLLGSAVSGFQQSIVSSASALGRALGDESHAQELNEVAGKLSSLERGKGRLAGGISGATRSFTDLLTGGGGATAIPLFALKATNQAIDDGRNAGLEGPELGRFALTQGFIEGAVTTAFQAVGAGGLESALRTPVKQGLTEAFKQIGKQFGFELVEEFGVELGQRLNSFLSDVDTEAFDINNLADAALDIALTTAISFGAGQSLGAVGNLAQQEAVSQQLEGAPTPQDLQQQEAVTEAPTPPTEQPTDFAAIFEQVQDPETFARIQAEQQAEATQVPTIPEVTPTVPEGETDVQTVERLLGPSPEAEAKAQAEQRDLEAAAEFEKLLAEPPAPDTVPQTKAEIDALSPADQIQRVASQRSPEGTTSARQVDIDADRKDILGDQGVPKAETRTFEEALEIAQVQNLPQQANRLAASVIDQPRALNDVETAGLVVRATELKNEHKSLLSSLNDAGEAQTKLAAAELERIEQEFDELTKAIRVSGSEKGRALASQKLTINRDFDLVSVLNRAKSKAGKNLTPKQRNRFEKLVSDLQAKEQQLEKLYERRNRVRERSPKLANKLDTQIRKAEFEAEKMRSSINRTITDLKPRSIFNKLISQPLNLNRAILTSLDVSAVLRQGGKIALGNPVRAAKSLKPMFEALASPQRAFEIDREIRERPNAGLYAASGLHLSPFSLDAELSAREEIYQSQLTERIPGVREVVNASERAFSTFLNQLRADSFDAMTEAFARNESPTLDESKSIANFINIATGRGDLGKAEQAAQTLSTVFFAPRYVASQFQFATGNPIRNAASPRARRLIAKEYGKFMLGWGVLAGLMALAGAEIEEDPRSSDFLKFKFDDTRIDLGTGLIQPIVLASRVLTGKTKSPVTGKVREIRGEEVGFGKDDTFDVLASFLRTKLAPGVSLFVDLAAGQNVVGDRVDVTTVDGAKQVAIDKLVPISLQEIVDIYREQDVPTATIMSTMALLGAGLSTFGNQERKERR